MNIFINKLMVKITLLSLALISISSCSECKTSPDCAAGQVCSDGTCKTTAIIDFGNPDTDKVLMYDTSFGGGGGTINVNWNNGDSWHDSDVVYDTESVDMVIPKDCVNAAQGTSSVGCEFYTVNLEHRFQDPFTYAVAVSNVQEVDVANVKVLEKTSSGWVEYMSASVQPMDLNIFYFDNVPMTLPGLNLKAAFKIESDVPIVAYQFSPIDGVTSFTSDASMLVPVSSYDEIYDVLGPESLLTSSSITPGDNAQAYFTIVATKDNTRVEIEMTDVINLTNTNVVPSTSSTPFSVNMDDGDVLEIQSSTLGQSITGARIITDEDHRVGVFSGHTCANIPIDNCCCDHLEEQMPGLQFWGKEFIGSRLPVRNTNGRVEPVAWQIYASEDDTTVNLEAASGVLGIPGSSVKLKRGEHVTFNTAGNNNPGDFIATSDKPISIMQYMTASTILGDSYLSGDPAMVGMIPIEQYLSRYVVLVPPNWINDALVITRHAGVPVIVDGVKVSDNSFMSVGNGNFQVARIKVDDGVHVIRSASATNGIGIIVVGWDEFDSYAYAGGMGLRKINPRQ
jgi:hypothetical protein